MIAKTKLTNTARLLFLHFVRIRDCSSCCKRTEKEHHPNVDRRKKHPDSDNEAKFSRDAREEKGGGITRAFSLPSCRPGGSTNRTIEKVCCSSLVEVIR